MPTLPEGCVFVRALASSAHARVHRACDVGRTSLRERMLGRAVVCLQRDHFRRTAFSVRSLDAAGEVQWLAFMFAYQTPRLLASWPLHRVRSPLGAPRAPPRAGRPRGESRAHAQRGGPSFVARCRT